MASQPDVSDDELELRIETETESVEETYEDGSIHRLLVTASWMEWTNSALDQKVTGKVEFTVEGNEAELTGFYPDTQATGRELYRETFRALRVIKHADEVARDRLPDDVYVEPTDVIIAGELTD